VSLSGRAQSEVTGTLLLAGLAISVTVLVVILVFPILEDTRSAPTMEFEVSESRDGLVLTHAYGDPVDPSDLRLVVRNESGETFRRSVMDGVHVGGDPGSFSVGERRVFGGAYPTGSAVVKVFHTPSGAPVFERRVTLRGPPNQPPEPSFSSTTISFGIEYDASASTDPDGSIAYYEWDTDGDGNFEGNTTDPVYTTGTFGTATGDVTLRVTDDDGASATLTKSGQPQPVPGFGAVAVLVAVLLGAGLRRFYRR